VKAAGETQIAIWPLSGMTSEQARDTRAYAWIFIFDCYARKKAAPASRPDHAEGVSNGIRATSILSENP
jgi:hypothetical protein